MNLEEIKQAIEDGHTVCWASTMYEVKKGITICHHYDCGHPAKSTPYYIIICIQNQNVIGLTHRDEITMNGKEEDFFINDGELWGNNWQRQRAGVKLKTDGGDPDVHPLTRLLEKIDEDAMLATVKEELERDLTSDEVDQVKEHLNKKKGE